MARRFYSNSSTTSFRSISLPSRTHPTTLRVEDDLKKLKSLAESSKTSANSICSALLGLQQLYKSIDDFLNLPLISQSLSSSHQKEKWVDGLLEKSVRFLDICGIAKETVSQCKENVRDVQSSLRRKKGSEESIEKYLSCRRKLIKKDIKRSVACLKQIDQEIFNGSDPTIMDLDHHVSLVIRLLNEANSTSTMIFQLVLKFLSAAESSKQKTNRWTIVAGILFGSEDQKKENFNELENVDAALIDQNKMIHPHIVHNRLENLEGSLERLENELEALSRWLIRSRTTLLNVFSC